MIIPGLRHSSEVIVLIELQSFLKDSILFYFSKNGVVLTKGLNESGVLPPKYFTEIVKLNEKREVNWSPGQSSVRGT